MQIKFSPIMPRPLNVSGMQQEFIAAMRHMGYEIREQFEDTTRTWNNQPLFEPRANIPVVGIDTITVETTTENQVYSWLNEGTKKDYPITIVNAKSLHFKSEFISKTTPGIVGSGVGFIGGEDRFPKTVIHPGVEARKWDKEIADRQQKIFKSSFEKTLSLVVKASGHRLS